MRGVADVDVRLSEMDEVGLRNVALGCRADRNDHEGHCNREPDNPSGA